MRLSPTRFCGYAAIKIERKKSNFFGGKGMTLGPKPIHRRMAKDIGQLDFSQSKSSSSQRVLWLSGMASVAVILLAATSVLRLDLGAERALIAESPAPVENDTIATLPNAIDETVPQVMANASVCANELNALARLSTIYFEADSDLLDREDLSTLRQVADALQVCPGMTLQVWGHADGSGDDETNLAISQKRADNTVVALAAMGFDTSNIQALAAGASQPKAQGDTDEALDRRVEFRVLPGSQN